MLESVGDLNHKKLKANFAYPERRKRKKEMAFLLSRMGFQLWSGICLIVSTTTANTIVGNETDRLALLTFKTKITEDPHGVVNSWNNSYHFCEWKGVRCGHWHKRVTIIDLQSRDLVGSLSPHIGNLSFLHELRLNNNTFRGEIPAEIGNLFRLQKLNLSISNFEGEIPANLSRCSNLTYLGVGSNNLVRKFPEELTSLSKLIYLGIHLNNLTGGIPPFIGNLTSLVRISASYNPFGGSIPDTLGQLKNLNFLGLGVTQLSGMIPPSIYNLSLLTVFSVPYNQLHGSLPPGFGSMFPHLQILQLYGNQFTGPLPLSISNSLELVSLDVGENNFNGKITNYFGSLQNLKEITISNNNFGSGEPDELAFLGSLVNCSNLEKLSMQGNQFRGVLPDSVGNLSNHLFYLTLSENQIYGAIPSTIGNLVNLALLTMYSNQFTGKIPTSIGFLQKLQRLSLGNNKLSGKIPNSIGKLSLLTELYLASNRIEGTIPSSLGTCRNLLSLHLFQNKLSVTIPRELLRISSLSISLNLAQNRLFGSLPTDVGNLKNLMELDISDNGLSGEIPSSLGSCTSLENLYLQENFFQGSIPLSLETLRGIANFDLSHNNLSGKIPTFLEKFALQKLNLSFNDFEGEVPMKGVFTNVSAISIIGNYRLCGGISELKLPNCITQKSKHKMPLSHILPITVASVLVGGTLVSLYIIYCSKKRRTTHNTIPLLKESFLKISYEKLFKATDGSSSANLISFGSFGSVYKGILDQDREFALLSKYLTFKTVELQRFMPNGNLEGWLHSSPETNIGQNEHWRLNLLEIINIAIDVACALDYLHHQCHTPIIHCDLKPSNILLDHDMVGHVGDFGLARFCPELTIPNQSSSIGIRGSIGYVPPGKRPTDSMFEEGLNLHSFARMAFPDHVMEIVDPMLLDNDEEEARATAAATVIGASTWESIQENNSDRMGECLISIVKIGVACSIEPPQGRMSLSNILHELHLIKKKLLQDELSTM
ncbi:unnamed protein product [Camellia sinensis]